MNVFIKLHYNEEPVYYNVRNINAFFQVSSHATHLYLVGRSEPFTVDESAEDIANALKRCTNYGY